MKNRLLLILILSALLFSCAAANTELQPSATRTPQIQTDCLVCFDVYESNGHNFIRITDNENGLVCWEDAGVVHVVDDSYGTMSHSSVAVAYAPALVCVKK